MKYYSKLLTGFVLLLAGTFFLFYEGQGNFVPRSVKELWDLGHIVYFALLIYLLVELKIFNKSALPNQWLIFLVFTLVLGTLIEILQYGTARSPDLGDISRDLTGCLLILSFHPSLSNFSSRLRVFFVRMLATVVFLIHLIPLTVALLDESTARSQFPVLSNFETPFEIDRWDGEASKEVVQAEGELDNSLLKISLTTARYSGVGMEYLPADWSEYQSVNLRIYQPSDEALNITVRMHDQQHETGLLMYQYDDRFNRAYVLQKGWNDIRISLSEVQSMLKTRKMDMSLISDISLFTVELPEPRIIYLDKIYLSD